MNRGVDMGARMAVHVQVAYQVKPRIPLGKLWWGIPRKRNRGAGKRARDINYSHRLFLTPAVLPDERHKPDASMILFRKLAAVAFDHHEILD